MKINDNVLDILSESKIDNNILYLPNVQLDRSDYLSVNKVLECLGGKWNRKIKGHIFDYCPEDAVDSVILTGDVQDKKKEFQFFPTPPEVAEYLCDLAEITEKSNVLEPQCGKGNLADEIYKRNPNKLLGIDINPDMERYMIDKPYSFVIDDFLTTKAITDTKWDRIVMNPPFSKQQDIDHVLKAFDVLEPGGILVSIMSLSILFRSNSKTTNFRQFIEQYGMVVKELPEGTFKESGTMVRACVIKLIKPN